MADMDSVEKTKRGFEASFASGAYYDRQTQDGRHLDFILKTMGPLNGKKVLDLGTGSGYLAFAIARAWPGAFVTGLDIVDEALQANIKKAADMGIGNVEFISYEGRVFPLSDDSFDWVATRYALHHFPDIAAAFREMGRVLRPGGSLFVADPTPNEADTDRFIDRYMRLKDDGHIRFYTHGELVAAAAHSGLVYQSSFCTAIRFPRVADERYRELMRLIPANLQSAYKMELCGDECFVSEDVLNMVFVKR